MKLNLLPTYVSKEKQIKVAIVVAVLMFAASVGASVLMITTSSARLQAAKDRAARYEQPAKQVVDTAKSAEGVIAQAQQVMLNVALARSMNEHNAVYPNFYDRVRPYVPAFFRVTSMSAQPISADKAQLTMTGVIKTYQEYADLMMALLRIPGAESVSRSGFQNVMEEVPPLTANDQVGRAQTPGEPVPPTDPQARINFFANQAQEEAYNPAGNFGQPGGGVRQAMPGYSLVTVSVVLPGELQTPDPRQTLANSTAAGGRTQLAGGKSAGQSKAKTGGNTRGRAGGGSREDD